MQYVERDCDNTIERRFQGTPALLKWPLKTEVDLGVKFRSRDT